jgi:hypothetical protein
MTMQLCYMLHRGTLHTCVKAGMKDERNVAAISRRRPRKRQALIVAPLPQLPQLPQRRVMVQTWLADYVCAQLCFMPSVGTKRLCHSCHKRTLASNSGYKLFWHRS